MRAGDGVIDCRLLCGPGRPGHLGLGPRKPPDNQHRRHRSFLADGGCYGSYGAIDQAVPSGDFALTGTYTQLMGAAPGFVRYPAQFNGTVARGAMTITVSVPTLPLTLGPYQLTAGVTRSWPACLYP